MVPHPDLPDTVRTLIAPDQRNLALVGLDHNASFFVVEPISNENIQIGSPGKATSVGQHPGHVRQVVVSPQERVRPLAVLQALDHTAIAAPTRHYGHLGGPNGSGSKFTVGSTLPVGSGGLGMVTVFVTDPRLTRLDQSGCLGVSTFRPSQVTGPRLIDLARHLFATTCPSRRCVGVIVGLMRDGDRILLCRVTNPSTLPPGPAQT